MKTIIIRHVRENLKKCSLQGLETDDQFVFFRYPDCALGKENLPALSGYVLLDIEGEPLSPDEAYSGIVVLDATWRLAQKMRKQIPELHCIEKRSIPKGFVTAYPRRQNDCIDPEAGLASIEAIFVAHSILGLDTSNLLNNYYWKDAFLEKNLHLTTR
jgi:pre-rRNA-processing protein TSR3